MRPASNRLCPVPQVWVHSDKRLRYSRRNHHRSHKNRVQRIKHRLFQTCTRKSKNNVCTPGDDLKPPCVCSRCISSSKSLPSITHAAYLQRAAETLVGTGAFFMWSFRSVCEVGSILWVSTIKSQRQKVRLLHFRRHCLRRRCQRLHLSNMRANGNCART